MLVRILLIHLVLVSVGFNLEAQKFAFHQYQRSEGLPSNEVRMVVQDHFGYMWLATDAGLVRFDGQEFSSYSTQLSSQYIKSFCPGPEKSFYFTTDAGLFRLQPDRDTAYISQELNCTVQVNDSSLYYPNRLYHDQKERLWISQPGARLSMWRPDADLVHFSFPTDHASPYSDSEFHLLEDQFGSLWLVAAMGQVYHFSEEEQKFVAHPRQNMRSRIYDLAIIEDELYAVGEGLWLMKLREKDKLGRLRKYASKGQVFRSIHSRAKQKDFLIGSTSNGLLQGKIQGQELLLQTIFGANDPHRIDELPFHCIYDIFVDERSEIWLSTAQGLGLLESPFFEGVFALVNNNTFSIWPSKDGVYLSFGDLYQIQAEGEEFFGSIVPNMEGWFINAITERANTLWVSTTTGELLSYRQGQIRNIIDLSSRGAGIFYMTTDDEDNLWFCQSPQTSPILGIARLDANNNIHYYEDDKGLKSRMLVVKKSPRGRIYAAGIGRESYLYRYRPEKDDFINLSLPLPFNASENFEVHDIAIDEGGIVWLGTTDGLLRFDLERVELVDLGPYTQTEVRAVCSNGHGGIWLATDTYGLLHYQDGHYVEFNESSGLPSKIAAYRCLVRDSEDRIWVGTAEGVVYSRDVFPKPHSTPSPIIQFLTVNGKEQITDEYPMTLSHGSQLVTDFVTLDFPGNQLAYRYRLEGQVDSTWQEKELGVPLQLGPMEQGDYQLHLQSRQAGGYYWSEALKIPFSVRSIWFKTWWGMALIGLFTIGLLFLLFRLNGLRLLKKIARLEGKLAAQDAQLKEVQNQTPTKVVEVPTAVIQVSETKYLTLLKTARQGLGYHPNWSFVINHLSEELKSIADLHAFAFGYYSAEMLHLKGYDFQRQSVFKKVEPFEENGSKEVWALVNKRAMHLSDQKGSYPSQILIPFEIPGVQQLVLVWYSQSQKGFPEAAFLTAQILADELSLCINKSLADD